mmetsp:Transcript_15188/g.65038  ORF Transcript_15188/g.65038 Transcript_15188/m.65038 type:complete len:483 (-) Transcript_15188:50-1498(-)|eukprot:CAMPEP_0203003714 /NCGR_PEP_ID=MMETSP1401-20130829/1981_1 /ASSEMBLY_ACC=CAM_ASM_000894 /TAXON_ID=38833 /ORGANISM="Micromonas pusilla, Strain CCAC1681" /LENGTH=482 /DNA_ID=CAMNT_0049745295 /DNA_START=125 /DNA_END=1573 /DNA_ORIENTATION=-
MSRQVREKRPGDGAPQSRFTLRLRILLKRESSLSLSLILLLVELALLLGGGVLVLLVLGHEVVHVGLGFGELHLVHALAGVPVKESLAAEHGGELLRDALEHLLHGGGVADEGGSHLEALGGDVAHGGLHVVGDPLDEVRGVLVLHVEELLVNLLGGHAPAEQRRGGEVATVAGIRGAHHVLGVPHLLRELGDGEGAVLLGAARGEGGEAHHEEVQAGERDQVHRELAEIRVELAGEAQAAGDAGHHRGDQVVQVTEGGGGELEGAEADVVQGLVVEHHALVGVLDELVDGQRRVVGLHHGVGHLGRGHDGEGEHHAVGVLLADLGDEERAHAGAGTATEGVADLETLEAVAGLGLLAHDVEHRVDELRALGVVTLGPVVTGAGLAEHEVVGAEDLAEGAGADGVHGAGLKVHQHGAGHVAAAGRLVVVDVDALQLEVGVTAVGAGGVDTVLIADNLPELGTDLVTALAALNVHDLAHVESF